MKIFFTLLLLFPLFSCIEGNQPETRPSQPVQQPQAHPPQAPEDISGDFTKVTEDGITVRFYGTFDASKEPEAQWLTENYLKASNKQKRAQYRAELNELGIQVEEMGSAQTPPATQQPQTYEQQQRAQREARREQIRRQRQQQRQQQFGK